LQCLKDKKDQEVFFSLVIERIIDKLPWSSPA